MSEAVNLFDTATMIDPYAAYAELRDNDPVHFVPMLNLHVVMRYELVRQALKDTQTFSSRFDEFFVTSRQIAFDAMPDSVKQQLTAIEGQMIEVPPTMLTLDEPEHTQYRSLVSQLFTGSQVKKSEQAVQAVIDRTIENLRGKTRTDFMADFAGAVPLRIIADRLGIPESERVFFDRAAASAASSLRLSPLSPDEMIERAQLALDLQALLVDLVEARRVEPQDDMITILANSKLEGADRPLTHGECLSVLNQFLVAGHETTTSTFGWGMLLLAQNPTVQDEIRGDVKLIRTFIEEALRLESPVQGLPRVVMQDTELGGYELPAGSLVMLRYGSANRDEAQFEGAAELNVHRDKAGMQLAFGSGVHHCIGAPLARQELNLGFYSLLEDFRDFRLNPQEKAPQAEPSFILRNLPYLHLEYAAR